MESTALKPRVFVFLTRNHMLVGPEGSPELPASELTLTWVLPKHQNLGSIISLLPDPHLLSSLSREFHLHCPCPSTLQSGQCPVKENQIQSSRLCPLYCTPDTASGPVCFTSQPGLHLPPSSLPRLLSLGPQPTKLVAVVPLLWEAVADTALCSFKSRRPRIFLCQFRKGMLQTHKG